MWTMRYQNLRPAAAHEALQRNPAIKVLDVRTEPEHRMHRIAGAFLLPVHEIEARHGELDREATYLVICEHGIRSAATCEFLAAMGFRNLINLVGGMAQWNGNGLPAERS
jgi:rhodanese-related sulfurtransferase